jgi:hypothetical protein
MDEHEINTEWYIGNSPGFSILFERLKSVVEKKKQRYQELALGGNSMTSCLIFPWILTCECHLV